MHFVALLKRRHGVDKSKDSIQAVIDVYKRDVDRTLLEANLRLTVEERILQLQRWQEFYEELQSAGKVLRNGRSTSKSDSGTSQE